MSTALEYPVFQANSVTTMTKVMEALALEATTEDAIAEKVGIDQRQANYYSTALCSLNLFYITNASPVKYALTRLGADFVNSDTVGRTGILKEAITTHPDVQSFVKNKESLQQRMPDYQEVTKKRRLDSIESLLNWARSDNPREKICEGSSDRNFQVAHGTKNSISYSTIVKGRGRTTPKIKETLCDSCFCFFNASLDDCPNC